MKDNCPTLMQSEEMNAPWNEGKLLPKPFDCTVCYCMSKSMQIDVMVQDPYDVDVSDINFIEEYENDDHATGIPTLLEELQKLCRDKIAKLLDEQRLTNSEKDKKQIRKEIFHYTHLIVAAKNWIVDDLDVCKDD